MIGKRNLEIDRARATKVVLPEDSIGHNIRRFDVSGDDTVARHLIKPNKVFVGRYGGKFVMINGKKRYLKT